ncbi:sulfonate ABC transporter substrate-binding protein [Heyndrickxia acidiproducens]|uniref:sulfonate ABC transporter substrate-binding protein n=1 Tax=Heyndrickxia acidiproducens TaxID=1121084 RepID=UPI000373CFE0|nr:sulfonate ABC transporter substrate-binding protein [Heyndrickxia acidiproducens]
MGKQKCKRALTVWLSFMLALSAIIVAACSGTGENSAKKKSGQVIRIGYQKNGPLLILKERGNLEKRLKPLGITVKWHEFQSGPALLESLNAGNIDFGRTGDSPPIFAQASGSTLKYVAAGKTKYKGSAILVKKNSPIQSIKDLNGKTIGFAKGSSSHYFIVKALDKYGIAFKDIKPAYLQPGDGRVAFEQGKIDAWVVWDPFTADAEISDDARMLTNGKGYTTDRDFFLATSDFLQKHEDIVQIVLEEVQHSSTWANENRDELSEMLSKALGIDKSAMKLAVERRVYGLDKFTPEIINEQQKIADTLYDLKMIPQKVKIKGSVHHFSKKDEAK